jgi:hypothetical protein
MYPDFDECYRTHICDEVNIERAMGIFLKGTVQYTCLSPSAPDIVGYSFSNKSIKNSVVCILAIYLLCKLNPLPS